MKIFEIHITGTKDIIKELEDLGVKAITIDLIINRRVAKTEYMSSIIYKAPSYRECKNYVKYILSKIKSPILRVKIESPFYIEYVFNSVYIESHFEKEDLSIIDYPLSMNRKSKKFLMTDREYSKWKYLPFIFKWFKEDVELCLYDSDPNFDKEWLDAYKN